MTGKEGYFPNGNFKLTEDFASEKLDYRWVALRGPREAFISRTKSGLKITPFNANIKELKPTSTLFFRQQHNSFAFTTTLEYKPESAKDLAGITCLQSEAFNYVFGVTKSGNDYVVVLQRNERTKTNDVAIRSSILASAKIDLTKSFKLRVEARGDAYTFSYVLGDSDFVNVGGVVSGDILSTDVAGGFTGTLLGLYATSANDAVPGK
jgi:alpha-N-arabinofuranosidase